MTTVVVLHPKSSCKPSRAPCEPPTNLDQGRHRVLTEHKGHPVRTHVGQITSRKVSEFRDVSKVGFPPICEVTWGLTEVRSSRQSNPRACGSARAGGRMTYYHHAFACSRRLGLVLQRSWERRSDCSETDRSA